MNIHSGNIAITSLATFRSLLFVYMFLIYWKWRNSLITGGKQIRNMGLSKSVETSEMTVLMLIKYMNPFSIPWSSRVQPKYLTNFLMVFHATFERL